MSLILNPQFTSLHMLIDAFKKVESKSSFPWPFSMPTQQCHDNTTGCDSRFRSNTTLANAELVHSGDTECA